jgi:RNA chaperone Hfq
MYSGNNPNSSTRPSHHSAGNSQRNKSKPFIAKGHDAILKDLQDNKHTTSIALISGEVYKGVTILARDKYTVTIAADGQRVTIYKHAIESFTSPLAQ